MYLKNFLSFHNLKQGIVAGLVVLGVIASEIPAAQSASIGCSPSGAGGSLSILDISSSYTCFEIGGRGLSVTTTNVYWTGIGTICNYQFKILWYTKTGKLYRTDTGPYHSGCSGGVAKKFYIEYGPGETRFEGKGCGELYESGDKRDGSPCLYIFP